MPSYYIASLKGQSKTILTTLAKTRKENLLIALGISIPTDETVESKFVGIEFESIANLFATGQIQFSNGSGNGSREELIPLRKPIALLGSTVQRFVLAGYSSEGLKQFEENEHLTSSQVDVNADAFEKHKMAVLQLANTFNEAAIQLTQKWLAQHKELLANYEIIDYEFLRQDVLFQPVYDYIEECFKIDTDFQRAVLSDAKQFVERNATRQLDLNQQAMTREQKTIIRYQSALHFIEQAAVFTVLWARRGVDAFAYPGDEINTHAVLKQGECYRQLLEVISKEVVNFVNKSRPMIALVILTKIYKPKLESLKVREKRPRSLSAPLPQDTHGQQDVTSSLTFAGGYPPGKFFLSTDSTEKEHFAKAKEATIPKIALNSDTLEEYSWREKPLPAPAVARKIPEQLLASDFVKVVIELSEGDDQKALWLGAFFYGVVVGQNQSLENKELDDQAKIAKKEIPMQLLSPDFIKTIMESSKNDSQKARKLGTFFYRIVIEQNRDLLQEEALEQSDVNKLTSSAPTP